MQRAHLDEYLRNPIPGISCVRFNSALATLTKEIATFKWTVRTVSGKLM